jgi:hypothetical protein
VKSQFTTILRNLLVSSGTLWDVVHGAREWETEEEDVDVGYLLNLKLLYTQCNTLSAESLKRDTNLKGIHETCLTPVSRLFQETQRSLICSLSKQTLYRFLARTRN